VYQLTNQNELLVCFGKIMAYLYSVDVTQMAAKSQIQQISLELSNMKIETDLKREVINNIMHHRSIGTYKGKRHVMGYPVRGQRTKTNARTARRLNGRWIKKEG
ncbi:4396_t:CDS:2, partial [Racocetra fulgida]